MKNFESRLKEVVARDGRYAVNAYRFIYEALDYTVKRIERKGHVTGRELLEGIRDMAIEQCGGLTRMVFDNWGVKQTADFGNIVFNLVESDLMSRTEMDSPEDFKDVYDFDKAFPIDAVPRSSKDPSSGS